MESKNDATGEEFHLPGIPKTISQEQGGAAAPEPVRFEPGTLYPLATIEQALRGVMELRTFLDGLRLSRTGKDRMFQDAVWGWEVLEAIGRHMAASDDAGGKLTLNTTRAARGATPAPRATLKQALDYRKTER